MNINMSSPMMQPGFGGFGQQGSSYRAPTFTQGQAAPSPSTGQQVGNAAQTTEEQAWNQLRRHNPGLRGSQWGDGDGGSTRANPQGINQPPSNMLANMILVEKEKAEEAAKKPASKAPAGAPTGPRGAQRSGPPRQKGAQINQPPREGRVRALQAIKKEEENIVEKGADSNPVGATLAPMIVDQGAENSSEEESFVIHKIHEETLVPDCTGKMVPVAELLRRAELRGAKNAMVRSAQTTMFAQC
jgi:hypothetical protein